MQSGVDVGLTAPSAATSVRPTPACIMHRLHYGCDPPPGRRAPTRRSAANCMRQSAAGFMHSGHLGCYSSHAVYGKLPPSSYPPACYQQSAIFPSNVHQLSLYSPRCPPCNLVWIWGWFPGPGPGLLEQSGSNDKVWVTGATSPYHWPLCVHSY